MKLDPKKRSGKKFDHALQMAMKAVENNNPKLALKYFTIRLRMAPWLGTCWLNRGIALSKLDRHQEAIDHFERAREMDSDEGSAWLYLGISQAEMGHMERALENFITFEQKKPAAFLLAWRNQARALFELERFEESLDFYKKIQAVAEDQENFLLQGRCLRYLERFHEAADAYDHGLALDPEDSWTRFEYGMLFEAQANFDAAIGQYRRALASRADFFEAWYQLSGLFLDLGRNQESLDCCQHACRIEPKDSDVWLRMGMALANMGKHEEAWPCCLRSIRFKPRQNSDAWLLRAHLQVAFFAHRYSENKVKKALKHWKRAMQSISHVPNEDWDQIFEPQLRHFASFLEPSLAQRLVAESGLGREYFSPTAIAIGQLVKQDDEEMSALSREQRDEVEATLLEIRRFREQDE